jgi:hypothetical protein
MAYAPVLPLSAKDGEGVDKLVTTIVTLFGQLNRRIETAKLNKAVEAWVEATPPPVSPRARFKLRYAVQTSINPQKFAIFASRPEAVTEAYVAFLRNKIREDLGMDKIPLTLEIKASHTASVYEAPSRAARVKASARPSAPRAASPKASSAGKSSPKKAAASGSAGSAPAKAAKAARDKYKKGLRTSSARADSDKEIRSASKKGSHAAPKMSAAARKGAASKRPSRAPARGTVPSKNPDSKKRVAAKRDTATRAKAQKRGDR